jgi:hypothetical protein
MRKKNLFKVILLLLLSGCAADQSSFVYKKDPLLADLTKPNLKLDFSKGEWLIGDIELAENMKEKFTLMALGDFEGLLGKRLKNVENQRALLLGKTPLNPTKKQIRELKIGTGFDFYINIKCNNGTTDMSNFIWTQSSYFKIKKNYATLAIEIYDLNQQEIVYSRAAECALPHNPLEIGNQIYFVTRSCYKKIYQDIKKISKEK